MTGEGGGKVSLTMRTPQVGIPYLKRKLDDLYEIHAGGTAANLFTNYRPQEDPLDENVSQFIYFASNGGDTDRMIRRLHQVKRYYISSKSPSERHTRQSMRLIIFPY